MSDSKVALDDAEYARVRLLLSRAAGLVFDESRRDSMGYSIGERLRALQSGKLYLYTLVLFTWALAVGLASLLWWR